MHEEKFVPKRSSFESPFSPQKIFEVAATQDCVREILDLWLAGEIAWENALVMMVAELSARLQYAYDSQLQSADGPPSPATMAARSRVTSPFVPDDEADAPRVVREDSPHR